MQRVVLLAARRGILMGVLRLGRRLAYLLCSSVHGIEVLSVLVEEYESKGQYSVGKYERS